MMELSLAIIMIKVERMYNIVCLLYKIWWQSTEMEYKDEPCYGLLRMVTKGYF